MLFLSGKISIFTYRNVHFLYKIGQSSNRRARINLGMNYSPSELDMVICRITTVAPATVTLTDSDGNSIYLRKCLPQYSRFIRACILGCGHTMGDSWFVTVQSSIFYSYKICKQCKRIYSSNLHSSFNIRVNWCQFASDF